MTFHGDPRRRAAWHVAPTAMLLLGASLLAGCGSDQSAIGKILESDREAHFKLDASAIAANVADTLVSVDHGGITRQSRAEVEAMFRSYFRGAFYRTWDDLEPPIIHVSSRGTMAWVIRRVQIDRDEPGLGGVKKPRRLVSAWTATYEKLHGAWKMTTVTSTFEPLASRANRVLAAARRGIGAPMPRAVESRALVTGPDSRFEVTVLSAHDGRVRIGFSNGLTAAVGRDDRWSRGTPGSPVTSLTTELDTFLRGHEVLMNTMAPETRYGPLHQSGDASFAGSPALELTGFDGMDEAVTFFYSRIDSMPLGFRVDDHVGGRGPVTVELGKWREDGGLMLPHRAAFRQGGEVYTYDFVDVTLDPAFGDSTFARPGAAP